MTGINEQNWMQAARLRVAPEQQRFVASATGILARAYAMRASRARVFGITDNNALVGLILVRDLIDPPACYELQQLLVDASAQNRGLAQSALKQLIALLAAEHRFDTVELCVHKDDAPALHLYRKLGFTDTGYIDPDLPDCLCLSHTLTPPPIVRLRPNVWAVGECAIRKHYPDAVSVARVTRLLEALAGQLDAFAPQLSRGPIHRDLHSKNLFFDGDSFTGFIDFDLAQINFRVYDLCYLACCESLSGPALDALLAGYDEVQTFNAAERTAFPALMKTCYAIYQAFLWKTGK